MKKVVVNFWAWSNICCDYEKGIVNGYNRCTYNYGRAYKSAIDAKHDMHDNPWACDYWFFGEVIKETEKAICFSVPCFSFNRRCDITSNYKWKIWIPKKCIITDAREFIEWGR